ncbi:uncharacterized protein LOC108892324 [Lates calcarifer]|uniref:Uncharacterized protein LOC108892324 n=1 Tax=Lates calcarifer TaxID=8187 RepID=A0AAJ7VBK7_LATCA|nr:uncharacterized protein LOC108892324 [Lates calcarifer]
MANKTELQVTDQTSSPEEELKKPAGRRTRRRGAATLGRRSQRGKRRGPADKRGAGREEAWSEGKEAGSGGEEGGGDSEEDVERWKATVRVFCRRPQVKIARHLLRKHADQQEVMAASTLPTGSKQRHLLLEHLRCRGNYLHNIEVIRQGSDPPASTGESTAEPIKDSASDSTGESVCDRADDRTSKSTEDSPSDPSGDAVTTEQTGNSETGSKRAMTSEHSGDQNATSDPAADRPRKRSRVQAAASRLLPISSGASESCSEVLHRMNQDYISHQVKSDWLICKYGNKLMGNQDGSQKRYDYVSQKLRELGRFLLAAKSLDSDIQTLQDVLAPGRLSLALAAARKASGYRWSRPPLAVKTTLKTVCEIAIGESLQDGDWEAAAKTTDFYHMLGREWDNLGLLNPDPDTAAPEGGSS